MEYVRLGATGLNVSRLCFGCMSFGTKAWREWVLEERDAMPFYEQAFAAGINFFDTAEVYSNGVSEEILGRAVKRFAPDREDVVIATKVFNGTHDRKTNRHGLNRKHILAQCDASLKRLGTDYIDLYQIHRFDPDVTMEETLEALSDLVRVGKVRYIGASSMYAWQFAKYLYLADMHGFARFASMQNHYNLIYREEEREMIPLCAEEGVGLIPWSPLARGFLAGNRRPDGTGDTTRANNDPFAKMYQGADFAVSEQNQIVARRLGVKPMQTALAWVLSNPAITSPIIGVTKPAQLEELVGALDIELSSEDKAQLESAYIPHPVLGISVPQALLKRSPAR